jgi:class 3 adenylate cyclase
MTVATSCRNCGTELRANAKFCDECGARIARAGGPAEYKQVTVLFADVVGSMDIAAAVDVERLREVMTDLVERSSAVVRHYGGTVDKFTGDGIMALFGAPVALEDHAFRACLAALAIQGEVKRLAAEVARCDGVDLRLRVGLNSGRVITGEIGSESLGYTAVGEQVGMAQRMESVAPPGGVMLSESTARLVEDTARLGEPELVHIKGRTEPLSARQLLAITSDHAVRRADAPLVGRQWERAAVEGILERSIGGRGGVVGVVGPAGIGKSRLAREVAAMAGRRGVEVFCGYCQSHARDVPFLVVTRLLRVVMGVADLDAVAARARVRTQLPDADPQDVLLLDDLLGIGGPDAVSPAIDPDARRRRLTALVKAAILARTTPAVFVIEDAHWIDEVSESMLADFLAVVGQTPSMAVITYRPEYGGALSRLAGGQTITVGPLSDLETATLIVALLGCDPTVGPLGETIAERAGGNPFYVEEMVRELEQRTVLAGRRGNYVCPTPGADIALPATLQATIAARIDRLNPAAKRTLAAASVIGSPFDAQLVSAVGVDPVFDELICAELIGQVKFTPVAEYAFRHPLIRSVTYESQLRTARAEVHRRLAAAIETRDPASTDENAAMIAEHWEAGGDLHAAYGWHMRAGAWAAHRDLPSANQSWERARLIADALPGDAAGRTAMRIAPRTLVCSNAWRIPATSSNAPFDELRELCAGAGDKVALGFCLAGEAAHHLLHARLREASRLASELVALLDSIDDPTLTIAGAAASLTIGAHKADWPEVLRLADRVVELAAGAPTKGNFVIESPLANALAYRANAGLMLGLVGWRDDLDQSIAICRQVCPTYHPQLLFSAYMPALISGVSQADDAAVGEAEEALQIAEQFGDDLRLGFGRGALGLMLMHRDSIADRDRGRALLEQVRDMCLSQRYSLLYLPTINVYLAREMARRGDCESALPVMDSAVNELFERGQLSLALPAASILAETLLDRGAEGYLQRAEAVIKRLADAPVDDRIVVRDITLLRLRALLARARGADAAYRHLTDRYREMANALGFAGHIAWAEAMT